MRCAWPRVGRVRETQYRIEVHIYCLADNAYAIHAKHLVARLSVGSVSEAFSCFRYFLMYGQPCHPDPRPIASFLQAPLRGR